MRDGMKPGDLCLFYHSNGTPDAPTGVYGVARVASAPHADETALDLKDEHYDPKAVAYDKAGKDPMWVCVDMAFAQKFARPVPLDEIKKDPTLKTMLVLRPGQRLSVMPVEEKHFKRVVAMGKWPTV
jgi:predicted RNA-binding protein with PUA-like domain